MTRLVYISGTRADFGLMKKTLLELNKYIDLTIIATGMHLSEEWGFTIKEVEMAKLNIEKVEMPVNGKGLEDMVKALGTGLINITQAIKALNPDIILVEGDRGEALIGAIIGAHLNIPIVHHGGGDKSSSIDNKIRNAITMFSDIHLVGNNESYNHLIKMGILKEKIFIVGEPGLDDIIGNNYTLEDEITKKFSLNLEVPLILLLFHPNTHEYIAIEQQISIIMEAIKDLEINTIGLYSNADAGGQVINEVLEKYAQKLSFLEVYNHCYREDFLGLVNVCDVMIGNSSSGLIELPSFKKPFINVGTRQNGRLKANNAIDVDYNKNEIIEKINFAIYNQHFKNSLNNLTNPYGDGKSYLSITENILKVIKEMC